MLLLSIGFGLSAIAGVIGFAVFVAVLFLIAWTISVLSIPILVAGLVGSLVALTASLIGLLLRPKPEA